MTFRLTPLIAFALTVASVASPASACAARPAAGRPSRYRRRNPPLIIWDSASHTQHFIRGDLS